MMNAGTIAGAFEEPALELTFTVQVWRGRAAATGIGSKLLTYTKVGAPVGCEIQPLSDEVRMLQVGQSDTMTHQAYFAQNTNLQPKDIVQIITTRRLGGVSLGTQYFVQEVLQPTSAAYGFIRCRMREYAEPTLVDR